jgi:hypothetical protein
MSPPVALWEGAWKHSLHRWENFTNKKQYKNQNNKIYTQTSLDIHAEGAGGHHPSFIMVWCGLSRWGGGGSHLFIFVRKVWKLVPKCIKRMCYKALWNFLTWLSSMVRNVSSNKTQLLPTRPRWLRSGCRGMIRPLSAPRIGPRGVRTSTPWTINCGLFWRTWLAESATTTWTAWRDSLWEQRQRFLWRQCVPR